MKIEKGLQGVSLNSFKVIGKFLLLFLFVLGLTCIFLSENLDYEVSKQFISGNTSYSDTYLFFQSTITEEMYYRIDNILIGTLALVFVISFLLVLLNIVRFLHFKFGKKVKDGVNALVSKASLENEDKAMERMLKLKQLYDSGLISEEEYQTKLEKLKKAFI